MLVVNGVTFSLVEILIWLVIAAICGSIAEALVGFSPGGLLASIAIGLVGAFIGSWLATSLGLPGLVVVSFGDVQVELLWTIIGAALLVALLAMLRRPRRRYRRVS